MQWRRCCAEEVGFASGTVHSCSLGQVPWLVCSTVPRGALTGCTPAAPRPGRGGSGARSTRGTSAPRRSPPAPRRARARVRISDGGGRAGQPSAAPDSLGMVPPCAQRRRRSTRSAASGGKRCVQRERREGCLVHDRQNHVLHQRLCPRVPRQTRARSHDLGQPRDAPAHAHRLVFIIFTVGFYL